MSANKGKMFIDGFEVIYTITTRRDEGGVTIRNLNYFIYSDGILEERDVVRDFGEAHPTAVCKEVVDRFKSKRG